MVAKHICGAYHHPTMPRNGEEHPAIAGLGHHQRVIALQELHVEHKVYTLTGLDHRFMTRLVERHHLINEDTRCIDDRFSLQGKRLLRLLIDGHHATHLTTLIVQNLSSLDGLLVVRKQIFGVAHDFNLNEITAAKLSGKACNADCFICISGTAGIWQQCNS